MEKESENSNTAQSSNADADALIKKIAAGDQSALMDLYNRTSRLVFSLVLRDLEDPGVAEEVLLDVYTRIWRQAAAYDPKQASAIAWMAAIARTGTIDRIGVTSLEAEPPDYLRDLLAARIEHESQPSAPRVFVTEAKKTEPELKRPAASPPPRIFAPPPQGRSHFPWLVVAALVIAAGLAFFAWRQADEATKRLNNALSAAQADVTSLRTLLEVQRDRNRELEQINTAIASPGARIIHLQGQLATPSASAVIFWDRQKNRWLITGYLPPVPEGKVYQLWFVMPKENVSAGLIQTDPLGHASTTIDITQDLSKLSAAAITLEPEGGSQQPAGPICAIGKVS